ncbi:hypothetical protein LOD99_6992 [Oopsacas minuta]|uniref:Uncharacterized protein n=1 Tax=Oopsacas minuta TaxID=111878 RepID=A0AAV7JKA2_9METZ|nr:hypothetical protein LOD99_6992 [Oopsacas minuta]
MSEVTEQQETGYIHIQELLDLELVPNTTEDDYSDDDYLQYILDTDGCNTQLCDVELTPEGEIPLELWSECFKCLFSGQWWSIIVLLKVMGVLKPSEKLAKDLLDVIKAKVEMVLKESKDDTESESESFSSSSLEDSDSSDFTD